MTAPKIPASTKLTPSSFGAKSKKTRISKEAGTKQRRTAGRPIRFKSPISKERPALARMIIKAIFLKSLDIARMD